LHGNIVCGNPATLCAGGTSGKPYLIRFKDGREIKSQEFLLAELKKIEPKL